MKSFKIYLILGGAFLLIYVIAEANRPKSINWTESLSVIEKKPFDTWILYHQLHDIFPNSKIVPNHHTLYSAIAEDSIANASYVIIAPALEPSKEDFEQLTNYIKAGNNVFIGAEYFGQVFASKMHVETSQSQQLLKNTHTVHFSNPSLDSSRNYTFDNAIGSTYFSGLDTAKTIVLGENNRHAANFVKINIGKGSLYLLCNPLFFSNYSLLDTTGQRYAANALSYIKPTQQIIWDRYYTDGDSQQDDSPMRLFLNITPLRWAYYIAIFSLLAFVLFEIKRRQRIIPVVVPLANSTLDFVNVVGQVYYEQKDNADIVRKKITYFLSGLRDVYQLRTNNLDKEFTEALAQKTGVTEAFATELVNSINYLNGQRNISNSQLIELNRIIEQFYIKSR